MAPGIEQPPGEPGGLTIGGLAAATGVAAATLRTWETRHGFPRPDRLESGHRRYRAGDAAAIEEVARRRASGQTLPAAIAAALAHQAETEPSVFAGLRRRHPGLVQHVVRKATALALTRAIEDECCARAERPVLFAFYQSRRFYRQSEARWKDLTRSAGAAVVFADFPGQPRVPRGHSSLHVPIPADSPLHREWVLVCDAADHPGCVVAWEFPGQRPARDGDRRFEVVWTVEPRAVRDAARICADLVDLHAPGAHVNGMRLGDVPAETSSDLRRAQGLLDRTLGYLDAR